MPTVFDKRSDTKLSSIARKLTSFRQLLESAVWRMQPATRATSGIRLLTNDQGIFDFYERPVHARDCLTSYLRTFYE